MLYYIWQCAYKKSWQTSYNFKRCPGCSPCGKRRQGYSRGGRKHRAHRQFCCLRYANAPAGNVRGSRTHRPDFGRWYNGACQRVVMDFWIKFKKIHKLLLFPRLRTFTFSGGWDIIKAEIKKTWVLKNRKGDGYEFSENLCKRSNHCARRDPTAARSEIRR